MFSVGEYVKANVEWCDGFEFIVMGCTKRNFYLEEMMVPSKKRVVIVIDFVPHMFQH